MIKEDEWRICANCGNPMLPIVGAPSLSYGCHVCGECWDESEVLTPLAEDAEAIAAAERARNWRSGFRFE
jgi:predicted amidophosphoribosyltransferase